MQVDDVTVGLMVQQFLDEWHFRVLHSGLAYAWDRPEARDGSAPLRGCQGSEVMPSTDLIISDPSNEALIKAMDIFEAAGMRITLEEKEWHGADYDLIQSSKIGS